MIGIRSGALVRASLSYAALGRPTVGLHPRGGWRVRWSLTRMPANETGQCLAALAPSGASACWAAFVLGELDGSAMSAHMAGAG